MEEESGLSGVWIRDPDESDDADEKMQAAMESMRERMGDRRRGGGFGSGGPRGGGFGGGRPGSGREGPGGGPRGPGMVSRIPNELTLRHESNELHVDDGERLRIYYLDGEKHKRQMPNGIELETVSELRGLGVYVDEKMRRGSISHEYELAPNGNVLVHTMTMKMDGMKYPLVIRTVYDRDDPR
jgi:hypothetical protein